MTHKDLRFVFEAKNEENLDFEASLGDGCLYF